MKLIIFCTAIFSLTALTVRAQDKVIADFDNVNPNAFWGWDNQPASVANPYKNGINTSDRVLEWKKSTGSWKAFVISFDAVDVSNSPVVSFELYSPVNGTISARLETGKDGETIYFNLEVTETNKWVTYTTDLKPLLKTVKSFTQASFFVNPEQNTETGTYYFDDLKLTKNK
jgi:hypothetical protein